MKRLCLFAGYSKKGVIEDYVIYYVRELAKLADVYYMADCEMDEKELEKLKPYVISASAKRHCKYDFGSWAELYFMVREALVLYDEVILTNDSVFGPLYPLEEVFAKMSDCKASAWSLCYNRFMMSFFVVLKRDVFLEKWFADFLTDIRPNIDKVDIVHLYESGMSRLIERNGKNIDSVFKAYDVKKLYNKQKTFIKEGLKLITFFERFGRRFRTNKIRLYSDDYFILFLLRFPFVKKQAFGFSDNHFQKYMPVFIRKYSFYDYELVHKSVCLNQIFPREKSCLWFQVKKGLKNFFFERRFKGDFYVYRICRLPLWRTKHSVYEKNAKNG